MCNISAAPHINRQFREIIRQVYQRTDGPVSAWLCEIVRAAEDNIWDLDYTKHKVNVPEKENKLHLSFDKDQTFFHILLFYIFSYLIIYFHLTKKATFSLKAQIKLLLNWKT